MSALAELHTTKAPISPITALTDIPRILILRHPIFGFQTQSHPRKELVLRCVDPHTPELPSTLKLPRWEFWNDELIRIDVDNPLLHNARMPTGLEEGANELFRWGGYTSGGFPELLIDEVPSGAFRATPTGIGHETSSQKRRTYVHIGRR